MANNDALIAAIQNAEKEEVAKLIQDGACLNSTHNNITPLHYAVSQGNISMVALLVELGADPNIGGSSSPLKLAAGNGDIEMAKTLLSTANIDVNATDGLGYTALHIAAAQNDVSMVQLLLSHSADTTLRTTNYGATPLRMAAFANCLQTLNILLANGAEPNTQDKYGNTPLHYATFNCCSQSVDSLLNHSAQVGTTNSVSATPLWNAVYKGYSCIAESLIQHGANLQIKSRGIERGNGTKKNLIYYIHDQPRSLLWLAVKNDSRKLIELLLWAGLDVMLDRDWILHAFEYAENPDPELKQHLVELVSSPRTLFSLCRMAIFAQYGRNPNDLPNSQSLPKLFHTLLKL